NRTLAEIEDDEREPYYRWGTRMSEEAKRGREKRKTLVLFPPDDACDRLGGCNLLPGGLLQRRHRLSRSMPWLLWTSGSVRPSEPSAQCQTVASDGIDDRDQRLDSTAAPRIHHGHG